MARKKVTGKRLLVLDTNVLMHDPTAIFRFHEHDVYLPMVVLEELDAAKKGVSEVARNVRQTNRFMDDLLADKSYEDIVAGIKLAIPGHNGRKSTHPNKKPGRIFFQTEEVDTQLPHIMPGNKPDNNILATALSLKNQRPETTVTLVSKDINLRIKAGILGIHAEDYYNDQVLDDLSELYKGLFELPANFWDTHGKKLASWQENGRAFYKISGSITHQWQPNACLYMKDGNPFDAIVRSIENNEAVIEYAKDYHSPKHSVWGVNARNREQNFALNLLLDPEVDFVSLQGTAGSGKTLLALAAGLHQTLDRNLYQEIIMTRVTVPVGEDIGFLPGTEEEKMAPWMGALMDNLEVLTHNSEGGDWERMAGNELIRNRVKIRSLNFMRGRTFLNKYLIIDEAQNLTSKQIKTLVTRAGPGTKIVCLGDLKQIDTPYLTEANSGLTYAIDRFKEWAHSGHITLLRGERSRLADYAAEHL